MCLNRANAESYVAVSCLQATSAGAETEIEVLIPVLMQSGLSHMIA